MAKAKASERTFIGKRKGVEFEVKSTMTDQQAIDALGGLDGSGFNADCAFEIFKMMKGRQYRAGLVAWGFHNAQQAASEPVKLSERILATARPRKPLKLSTPDGDVVIGVCGPKSAHEGKYRIATDAPYGTDAYRFYGFAEKSGAWQPSFETPAGVIEAIKNF